MHQLISTTQSLVSILVDEDTMNISINVSQHYLLTVWRARSQIDKRQARLDGMGEIMVK